MWAAFAFWALGPITILKCVEHIKIKIKRKYTRMSCVELCIGWAHTLAKFIYVFESVCVCVYWWLFNQYMYTNWIVYTSKSKQSKLSESMNWRANTRTQLTEHHKKIHISNKNGRKLLWIFWVREFKIVDNLIEAKVKSFYVNLSVNYLNIEFFAWIVSEIGTSEKKAKNRLNHLQLVKPNKRKTKTTEQLLYILWQIIHYFRQINRRQYRFWIKWNLLIN